MRLSALIASIVLTTAPILSNALTIGTRSVELTAGTITEPTLRDAAGREIHLRGWNVSGSVKLASRGFKPFMSREDAANSFELMKRHTGSNMVRFTLSWEGTHLGPDTLDYAYVDALIEQMREAFKRDIYIFLDYHMDIFSRHVFSPDARFTGNGAPEWIVRGTYYPKSNCGPLCFAWSQHNVTDPAVRSGYRNFWDNIALQTSAGERRMQDEFMWQLVETLRYIKSRLTPEEFAWITGVQPVNEPIYGRGHTNKADEFDNQKLWPFYRRVRAAMDSTGWADKWVYAEPMVFWDTNVGFFTPPTGGHYLREKPVGGYIFAPHFYDAARMGISNAVRAYNGEYFHNLDMVRKEGKFLGIPNLLGEFGMWLKDQNGGVRDYARIVKGTYQAMEASDTGQATKTRRPDFHTAYISGTQWHWDTYKDSHLELQNGNPKKKMTTGDAWNGEDFSAIKGDQLTVNPDVIRRAYPRAVAGDTVSFYYNDMASDGAGIILDWAEIRVDGRSFFGNRQFALLLWQDGTPASTEIFVPASFSPASTVIITDAGIHTVNTPLAHISMRREFTSGTSGYQLQIGHTVSQGTRFALVVNAPIEDAATLEWLRNRLISQVAREEHPVYFRGRMAGLNYPEDGSEAISLTANESRFALFRRVSLQWSAAGPVDIWQKSRVVMKGARTGNAILLSFVGAKDTFKVCEQGSTTRCSRQLRFD